MFNLFNRVAAWIVRQLSPPAGRHRERQRPLLRDLPAPTASPSPAGLILRPSSAAPRWSLIRAEETALVRPYVLAAERRRGHGLVVRL